MQEDVSKFTRLKTSLLHLSNLNSFCPILNLQFSFRITDRYLQKRQPVPFRESRWLSQESSQTTMIRNTETKHEATTNHATLRQFNTPTSRCTSQLGQRLSEVRHLGLSTSTSPFIVFLLDTHTRHTLIYHMQYNKN